VRSRAKPDGRRAAVLAAALAALWLAAAPARAEVIYDLAPAAGVGITDNAPFAATPGPTTPANAPRPQSDLFTVAETAARLRYVGANSNESIGYRLSWTHYLQHHGIDNLSNELLATANLNPSARLELHLTASAAIARTSRIVLGDPALAMAPQGVNSGTNLYLTYGAGEEAVYRASARWQYLEYFSVNRIHYLEHPAPPQPPAPPDGMTFTARARADLISGRDAYSLEASSFATIAAVNSVSAQLLAGWRREIDAQWTAEIQAGAMAIFPATGSAVIGPGGNAAVNYRRVTWFATLTASRSPTPNLYLGSPTVNNQALLRLTLPLTRDESAVVSGMASYLYANPADAQFTRAYDSRSAAALIGSRIGRLPLYASLEYTVMSQHNNPNVMTPAPNLFRQVLMLNIRASFTFGPGTPPILGAPI
jgi:hypothetical protein